VIRANLAATSPGLKTSTDARRRLIQKQVARLWKCRLLICLDRPGRYKQGKLPPLSTDSRCTTPTSGPCQLVRQPRQAVPSASLPTKYIAAALQIIHRKVPPSSIGPFDKSWPMAFQQ